MATNRFWRAEIREIPRKPLPTTKKTLVAYENCGTLVKQPTIKIAIVNWSKTALIYVVSSCDFATESCC